MEPKTEKLIDLAVQAVELSSMSSEEAFQALVKGAAKTEETFQRMIDSIVAIQDQWPMPEEGWKQFVEDMEHTNEKYGFNLHIKE